MRSSVLARGCLLAVLLPLLLAAQKVNVEFDDGADFFRYRTFMIREGQIHSTNPSLNNDLVRKKIESLIRQHLTAKGLIEVEKQPDLNVRFSLGAARRTQVEQYPAGWRWYGTRVVRVHYTEGTLVVDLRDAKARALVWRAIAVEDKNDPGQIQKRLDDMVRKSIEKYPPKK
jgi:hypothetical protein